MATVIRIFSAFSTGMVVAVGLMLAIQFVYRAGMDAGVQDWANQQNREIRGMADVRSKYPAAPTRTILSDSAPGDGI